MDITDQEIKDSNIKFDYTMLNGDAHLVQREPTLAKQFWVYWWNKYSDWFAKSTQTFDNEQPVYINLKTHKLLVPTSLATPTKIDLIVPLPMILLGIAYFVVMVALAVIIWRSRSKTS